MYHLFSSKKVIGITLIIAAGVLSFFFRNDISQWLAFNDSAPPVIVGDTHGGDKTAVPGNTEPVSKPPPPGHKGIVLPSGSALPRYTGRDPMEVRPNPEDVKLFSEQQKKDLYAAIGNHGKAVKENLDYFNGWVQLGLIKKVIGDYEGARDAWEYAGMIRPLSSTPFANLGELYWRYLPHFSKSEANFKTAIKNNPMDEMVYISLSDLYFYSYAEKAGFADDILLRGLEENPNNVNLLKALARVYEREKEYAKAIETWERVLGAEPGNTQVAATLESLKKKSAQ